MFIAALEFMLRRSRE